MEMYIVLRLVFTLSVCFVLINVALVCLSGIRELATEKTQQTTTRVSTENDEQKESITETTPDAPGTEQVWEQTTDVQEEYTETVGMTGSSGEDSFTTQPNTWLPAILVLAVVVGASSYKVSKWVHKLLEQKRRKDKKPEAPLKTQEQYFDDTVEDTLLAIEVSLDNRMIGRDKNKFKDCLDTACEFDAMFPEGGAIHGRIGSCYLPELLEMAEKIANAPSLSIAKSLLPYFYRACDVLREAMEGELDTYKKAATMDMAARATALEKMAAAHHDTSATSNRMLQRNA